MSNMSYRKSLLNEMMLDRRIRDLQILVESYNKR